MEIKCITSGSSGNCYLLIQNNECLVLECGLKYKCIVKALINATMPLNRVLGVICSHSHKDHSQSLADFQKVGIKTAAPKTIKSDFVIDSEHPIDAHSFSFLPFEVKHDTECYGFVIADSLDNTHTLFITDTGYLDLPDFVKNIQFDSVYIECNHIRKALDKKYQETNDYKYLRQGAYHLSLKACKKMLKSLDLSKCKEINLIHFSKEVGYPELCKKDIEETFKIKTNIC